MKVWFITKTKSKDLIKDINKSATVIAVTQIKS